MTTQVLNPLEQMVEDLAQDYVDLVNDLAQEFAPVRPWWDAQLSADEQLWRWQSERDPIMAWLMEAGVHMGYASGDETLKNLEEIFTNEAVIDMVPAEFVITVPPSLLEMVQSSGPKEAAKHIRKMEQAVVRHNKGMALLQNQGQPNFPEPPNQPPPLPVTEVPGTAGYPLYGMAPTDAAGAFQPPVPRVA